MNSRQRTLLLLLVALAIWAAVGLLLIRRAASDAAVESIPAWSDDAATPVMAARIEPCLFASCLTLHYREQPGMATMDALVEVDGVQLVSYNGKSRYTVNATYGKAFTLEEVAAKLHAVGLLAADALPVKQPDHVISSGDNSPNIVGSDGDVVITYGGGR